jgi:hypothetical protein
VLTAVTAIFISHSSRDNDAAAEIKAWLAAQNFEEVFLDFNKDTGLGAGRNWERELYEKIERCQAMIVVVTPAWLASKWCFAEFTNAQGQGKAVFPIILTPDDVKVIGPELTSIQSSLWDAPGQEHLRRRLLEVAGELARGYRFDPRRPPWPGILSYDVEDAAVFFGRDPEIRRGIELLESRRVQGGPRLLLIAGASGSGKSSLLKAGILPYLKREERNWLVLPPFRPGAAPLTSLAKMLAEAAKQPESWPDIRDHLLGPEGGEALAAVFGTLQVGAAREATILLSIDQLEEVWTASDDVERKSFLEVLRTLGERSRSVTALTIVTIRSDLLGSVLKQGGLDWGHETYALGAIPYDRLPSVITGPARVASIGMEQGLCERILRDVESPEILPLLAFALRELNDRFGSDKRLQIVEYEALGDPAAGLSPLDNAVRRAAEETLAGLRPTQEELDALKTAFVTGLVRIRDDGVFVRRQARRNDLPPAAGRLLDAFTRARLLTAARDESGQDAGESLLEIAHEALFKAWPQLHRWLEEERGFLVWKSELERALAEWIAAPPGQKSSALLHGLRLARASEWLRNRRSALSPAEITFISSSRRRAEARTWYVRGLTAAVLFAVLGGSWFVVSREMARLNALECDLLAAETDNNVSVPGVAYDKIDTAAAIPACREAVAAETDNPRLMHNLARSLEVAGAIDEAVKWYRDASALGYSWSMNNLGNRYIGRGPHHDFEGGVALLRQAAERGNEQALVNYIQTDMSRIFTNAAPARILESALIERGFLDAGLASGTYGPPTAGALEAFKKANGLDEKGASLRVLDNLGIIPAISSLSSGRS